MNIVNEIVNNNIKSMVNFVEELYENIEQSDNTEYELGVYNGVGKSTTQTKHDDL